jgi:hypothetical protein
MGEKYQKTKDELKREFSEQLLALRAAAKSYDSGNHWSAKDLASIIYILFHDGTGRIKSLLRLLGLKGKINLLSSYIIPPTASGMEVTVAQSAPLIMLNIRNDQSEWVPIFDDNPFADQFRWLSFQNWWEEKIFHPVSTINLSRKNIIFSMRNQDGGSHVDSHITNEDYATFSRKGDPWIRSIKNGVSFGENGGEQIPNAMRAIVRQLAWEVDQSLIRAAF